MIQKKEMLAYIASIVYASIFGFSFLFSKSALAVATPLELISFRFLLAFLFLSVLLLCRIIKVDYRGKNLKSLLFLSIIQPCVYFIFETYGLEHTSSSYAGLMVALIPVVVTLLAIGLLKERPNKIQMFFIILSVAGVIYIVLNDSATTDTGNTLMGTIFLLIAVFASSFYNILSRRNSVEFSPVEMTYFMMGTGVVVFNGISIVADLIHGNIGDYFIPLLEIEFLMAISYLGILSSVIAFFSMNFSLSILPASRSVVFGNLATVISILAGVFILKEPFYYYHIIGSIFIILGIIGTNYFNTRSTTNKELEKEMY